MAVGGVAVRVTAEALSSGSVRLKHSTAEQFLVHETLRDSTETSTDGLRVLVLNPCPAQGFASPVYAQLRRVSATARQSQALDTTDAPPPPSLSCELCGLGAWLRGQGAVPGVHWVQLWRGAGGALGLRLCDGKPTELPGEHAAMQQQQMDRGGPAPNAAVEDTAVLLPPVGAAVVPTAPTSRTQGASDAAAAQAASAKAVAAHAAAAIVGPAAQAVADAAAPWQHHDPTGRAPCMPARAAWHVPATGDQLGAAGAGADGVGYAARRPANGGHRGPLTTARRRTVDGGGSGLATIWGAGRDCVGADGPGLLDAARPQPCRGGDEGNADHLLSLSQPPMPPPPLPPPGLLGQPAVADDVFSLWRDYSGPVWASQQHSVFMQGHQQQETQQQQQQHDQGGVAGPGRPSSTGMLTGRVDKHKINLRTEEVQGLLAPSLLQRQGLQQSRPEWITMHVEEAGGNHSKHVGAQHGQQQGSEFTVRLLCTRAGGRYNRWYLSSASALIKALGAVDRDTVQLQYESDGRLVVRRAAKQPQQQQAAGAVPLAMFPADSILVGYSYGSRMDAQATAVRTLWPEAASQLACGQSTEVEVHPAVAEAGGGVLGPLRLTLKLHSWPGRSAAWRLTDCGPLFRALGAQYHDAILMWRSPGDGRLMVGVRPRCGMHRGREEQQQGQQGQEQDAGQQQGERQGQQVGGSRPPRQGRARQGALHRLYGEYVVQEALDGKDGKEDERVDDGDGGVEKWDIGESEEEGPPGPPGPPGDGGLSRPPKRARAAEAPAQLYGRPSAAHQQQQMQLTACPAGSILVGSTGKHRAQLNVRAAAVRALWPEIACQRACSHSTEVEVHAAAVDAGGAALGPFRLTLKLYWWPGKPSAWRLNGCGPLFRALGAQDRDAVVMWRSPGDGRMMAGVHPRGGVRGDRREARLGQQQGQEAEQQQGQGQEAGQEQGQEQDDGRRRQLRRRAVQRPQGALHRLYGGYVVQEPTGGEGAEGERLGDNDEGVEELENGVSEEEGQGRMSSGLLGDGLSRPSKLARIAEGATQQCGGPSATQQHHMHQVQLTACPAGSLLVGYMHRTQLDVRATAVHALWPEVASQLACGHSTEVEVLAAVAADAGGQALGPFRLTPKLQTWKGRSPKWRLTGCGPLFQALGAQDRDAIHMWRSPGDGRLVAGVQPKGGVRAEGGDVQVGQLGAGLGWAGRKVRQVYDEYDVHESTDEGEEELGLEEDEEETEEGSGGYWEEEEREEEGEEEELDQEGFGGKASFGAGWEEEGRGGQGSGVLAGGGGGWGWEEEGLRSGGDNEAGVGEAVEEEGEEAEDPGVNWWAREVGREFGVGEESDGG